jgi:saccharopine dehydrogenase-like NADP-dependent oxidoreductase
MRTASIAHTQAALKGKDLVIHAAGPFQQSQNHRVLEQALTERVAYVDVCDDMHFSER